MAAGFKLVSGTPVEIVQYRNLSDAMADLGTLLDVSAGAYANFARLQTTGKIKVLAAATQERTKRFPDVPSFGELGYGDAVVDVSWGLIAPRKTSDANVGWLYKAFYAATQDPDAVARLGELDIVAASTKPGELDERVRRNSERMKKIVDQTGLAAN
jgi:tripartite-type tricarboxylate transporter receptor subunit TctC